MQLRIFHLMYTTHQHQQASQHLSLVPLLRTVRSCDRCKQKKIKCNTSVPCDQCLVHKSPCTYNLPNRRKRYTLNTNVARANDLPDESWSQLKIQRLEQQIKDYKIQLQVERSLVQYLSLVRRILKF
jgi:hypothetical protein